MQKLRRAVGCSQGFAGGEALQEEPLKDHKKKNQPPVKGTTALQISQVGVDSDPLGLLKCKLFGWSCRGPLAKLEVRKAGVERHTHHLWLEDQQGSLKKSSKSLPNFTLTLLYFLYGQDDGFKKFLAESFFASAPGWSVSWLIHTSKYFDISIHASETGRVLVWCCSIIKIELQEASKTFLE